MRLTFSLGINLSLLEEMLLGAYFHNKTVDGPVPMTTTDREILLPSNFLNLRKVMKNTLFCLKKIPDIFYHQISISIVDIFDLDGNVNFYGRQSNFNRLHTNFLPGNRNLQDFNLFKLNYKK